MESVGFFPQHAGAVHTAHAAALDTAGNEAVGKLADQRQRMDSLLVQITQQQVDIVGNMQTMQAKREAIKSIMEQFNAEAHTTKELMKNQSVGLAQFETRIEFRGQARRASGRRSRRGVSGWRA